MRPNTHLCLPLAAAAVGLTGSSAPVSVRRVVAATGAASPACIVKSRSLFSVGGGADGAGVLRRTPLLRYVRQGAQEILQNLVNRVDRADEITGSSMLELNLLEDPSAGLASGPAEELTPTELETRVRVLVSSYTPSLFRLLYTPFIDVVGLLVTEGLVPEGREGEPTTTTTSTTAAEAAGTTVASGGAASLPEGAVSVSTSARPVRPEEVMGRWFTDGAATLKHPHETAEAMGKRRWTHLCRALEAHWAEMESVMPLTRVVRQHALREELYVPMLRQLAMELADPTKRAAAVLTLPGLILSLANGRAPRSLGLPENDAERIQLVSGLFLGVAQEAGDTDLAYLALQLLRANNMAVPFAAQKQLTNVFAAASRIKNDWQVRGSSLLVECFRRWLDYFKEVQQDNLRALKELDARDEAAEAREEEAAPLSQRTAPSPTARLSSPLTSAAAGTGATSSEETEQYRYFTSRRQDDVTRIAAIETNIEAAVRERAGELRRRPVRGRGRGRGRGGGRGRAQEAEVSTAARSAAAAAKAERVPDNLASEGDDVEKSVHAATSVQSLAAKKKAARRRRRRGGAKSAAHRVPHRSPGKDAGADAETTLSF